MRTIGSLKPKIASSGNVFSSTGLDDTRQKNLKKPVRNLKRLFCSPVAIKLTHLQSIYRTINPCPGGGVGRRTHFEGWWATVRVRVRQSGTPFTGEVYRPSRCCCIERCPGGEIGKRCGPEAVELHPCEFESHPGNWKKPLRKEGLFFDDFLLICPGFPISAGISPE